MNSLFFYQKIFYFFLSSNFLNNTLAKSIFFCILATLFNFSIKIVQYALYKLFIKWFNHMLCVH